MTSAKFTSVDSYLAAQPLEVRWLLERIRRTIRKAVPAAEESISYNIPTYKLGGRPMLYFAAWKEHYSLYPSGSALVAAFKKELAPYEVEKGTIRFPLAAAVPVGLIGAIAKFRAKEVTAVARPQRAAPATRQGPAPRRGVKKTGKKSSA
jgi:uncharacterized protein YdhG (YjbR/CyaY superfamily)